MAKSRQCTGRGGPDHHGAEAGKESAARECFGGRSLEVPVNEDAVPPDVIDQNWLLVTFGGELLDARHGRRP